MDMHPNGGAAARIRKAIVGGELASGERLVIADLVRRFDLSPMPVREALRRLEGEGLVETTPNRGATVRRVDAEMVANIYDVRLCLESMLVERSIDNLTLADIREIERKAKDYEQAIVGSDVEQALECNRILHRHINRLGNNKEAYDILERGSGLIAALRSRFGFSATRMEAAAEEHRSLLDALRKCDKQGVLSISRMHTIAARKDMLERME